MCESLEKNNFYRTLNEKYSDVYAQLTNNRWVLCVPTSDVVADVELTRKFITAHVLKPSPLLKCHYIPLNPDNITDVEIENNKIKIRRKKSTQCDEAFILGEEIGYNARSERYPILLVSAPFVHLSEKRTNSRLSHHRVEDDIRSFDECRRYLCSISEDIVNRIERKVNTLNDTYMVLPDYLEDAADRFKAIIDWSLRLLKDENSSPLDDFDDYLAVAVENFVVGLARNKILPAICKKFSGECRLFKQKAKYLKQQRIKPVDLGAQKVFADVHLPQESIECLKQMESADTSFEKVYLLWKILNTISDTLTRHVQQLRLPFAVLSESPAATSDDVLAFAIMLLSEAEHIDVISNLNFLKMFSWYLPSKNHYGYSLVTFEVAVEYIKSFSSEDDSSTVDNRLTEIELHKTSSLPPERVSSFENELEKICTSSVIEDSCKNSVCTSTSSENSQNNESELGQFLSTLSKRYYVAGYGKQ